MHNQGLGSDSRGTLQPRSRSIWLKTAQTDKCYARHLSDPEPTLTHKFAIPNSCESGWMVVCVIEIILNPQLPGPGIISQHKAHNSRGDIISQKAELEAYICL